MKKKKPIARIQLERPKVSRCKSQIASLSHDLPHTMHAMYARFEDEKKKTNEIS